MFICPFQFRKDNIHAGKILLGHLPEISTLMMSFEDQVFADDICPRAPKFQIMNMICHSLRQ